MVSVDQLAECLADQKISPAQGTLGTIMLRKGLIKQRDLDALLEEQKRRLAQALELSDPKLEDALLGRLLIKQGLGKEAQLYECLRAGAELGEKGEQAPRLGELLVRKGYLTTDAVDRILPPINRKDRFICPRTRPRWPRTRRASSPAASICSSRRWATAAWASSGRRGRPISSATSR